MTRSALTALATLRATDYDYALAADRIAQEPLAQRGESRLLHVAAAGTLTDHRFHELPDLLRAGDLCVANETRVRKARLMGRRDDGGEAEALVLSQRGGDGVYLCLARPARKLPVGARIRFGATLAGTIIAVPSEHAGARIIQFTSSNGDVESLIERVGMAPVPPYIRRPLDDPDRYQTVFARGEPASAAAPTAGLHFTDAVIARLAQRGIGWATLRLDVGLATFAPMRDGDAATQLHEETFAIPIETAVAINHARERGGRVIAVGTTVVRALESQVTEGGMVVADTGRTRLFIRPGHGFRCVDGLLTNFHQPRSTLLVLLAAFIGPEAWRDAYGHALTAGYRFLSFGDCMLCWRRA